MWLPDNIDMVNIMRLKGGYHDVPLRIYGFAICPLTEEAE